MPPTSLPPSPLPATTLSPTPFDAMVAVDGAGVRHRKGDLHSNAASLLRKMILTGALAPGERLNERELCERLKVSRTPVREAIKTLTQEGLLNSLPNRSPVVAPLDAAHTSALIEVVATIEGWPENLQARRVSDAEIAELGILHYTMLKHHARDELPAISRPTGRSIGGSSSTPATRSCSVCGTCSRCR
jgi:DNA-binding GntR family transcriptional regulator